MPLSKGPGDEPAQEEDYYSKYLNPTASPADADLEPGLQELLKKLYDRQEGEHYARLDHLDTNNPTVPGHRRGIPASPVDEEAGARYKRAIDDQFKYFAEERERYIAEYQEAQSISDEMQQQSREQALEQGLDDKPKRSY
jgi:hypothetical protein